MKRQVILGDAVDVRFENRYVVLYWNDAERWVGTWWKKAELGDDWAGSGTVKESLEKGLELIIEKRTSCWIADCRDMAVMPPDLQRWLTDDWWPRALRQGFRWLAILLPKSTLAKMALDVSILPSKESPLSDTQYFGEADEAKAWLRARAEASDAPRR